MFNEVQMFYRHVGRLRLNHKINIHENTTYCQSTKKNLKKDTDENKGINSMH